MKRNVTTERSVTMVRTSPSRLLFFAVILVSPLFAEETIFRPVAVVSPQEFRATLQPWVHHRESQGYTVHFITSNSLDTEGIKSEIRLLAKGVPLSAVLIVGDFRTVPSPRIPCRIIQRFGEETELVSDNAYVDLDDDGISDFAIGRFPASSIPELERMIEKTIRYETKIQPGFWSRQIQIVAGTGNFSPILDGVIESSVRHAISETIPPSWDIAFLHADWQSAFCPSPFDFHDELVETVNRAPLFWAYFGHGRHRMLEPLNTPLGWAPTLHGDEMPRFQCRDNFPIALLFCCYGGMFDQATPSLAEEILRQSEGPVAVVAACRTTMPYGMSVFGVELFRQILLQQGNMNRVEFGSLLLEAKRRMLLPVVPHDSQSRQRSTVRNKLEMMAKSFDPSAARLSEQLEEHATLFHLFGDPLLGVPLPKTIQLKCPQRVRAGDPLRIEGSLEHLDENAPFPKLIRLELLPALDRLALRSPDRSTLDDQPERRVSNNREYRQSNGRILLTRDIPLTGPKFEVELSLPENLKGKYVVRSFSTTTDSYAIGYAEFSIGVRRKAEPISP